MKEYQNLTTGETIMIVTVTDKKTGEHYQTHIDVLRVVDEDTRIRVIPYGQGIHTIYYADMVTVKVTDNDNSHSTC